MKGWFRMSVRNKTLAVFPDPSRYAVDKLTVANRQHADGRELAKREKEIRSASLTQFAVKLRNGTAFVVNPSHLLVSKAIAHHSFVLSLGQSSIQNGLF
jgi:hypothetical protein